MNSDPAGPRAEPFFLDGADGARFALHHPPSSKSRGRALLMVPPFAEELNKSRRMLALQARALADAGVGVLLMDLYGTGESAGEFIEADWASWREDLAGAHHWLQGQGYSSIDVLALRLGVLLAFDAIAAHRLAVARAVLWQPVTHGGSFINQFLRMRVAAGALGARAGRQSTAELRALAAREGYLEVGGYELNANLMGEIERLHLEKFSPPASSLWLELSSAGAALTPVAEGVLARWREAGHAIESRAIAGAPFWTTAEIATAPGLIDVTTNWLSDGVGGR